MVEKLSGVFSPLSTIFDDDEALNLEKLAFNMQKYAVSGIKGYLVLGSNGENKSLTDEEKEAVLKTVIQHKGTDQVIMAGSIFESTIQTIEFAKKAAALGADFITLLPPCYFKKMMTDEALARYFTDVASAVDAPCLLYNAPQFAGGVSLSVELIRTCAKHPNIVGVKDSSSDMLSHIDELVAIPDFTVLSGSASTFIAALDAGAVGGIISLANSMPELVQHLYEEYLAGNRQTVESLNEKILRANKAISGKYGVAGVKEAMRQCGFEGGIPRRPLLPVPEGAAEEIARAIGELRA